MNIRDTFVEIASDSPVSAAVVPEARGDKITIARIEYELLSRQPYTYTLEELKFAVHVRHKSVDPIELQERRQAVWATFFSKPYACMRASPLPKQYGWGVHYDSAGRIAIVPAESEEYRKLAKDKKLQHCFAMRSRRA